MNTKAHYEGHLADYYSWIFGGHTENIKRNRQFFEAGGLTPIGSGVALDLGAGSGFQSIPLAELGFRVTAVDFSARLLDELKEQQSAIQTVEDDVLNFASYAGRSPELIICMGDTLTHLPDNDSVVGLINNAYQELVPNGRLVLSLRDLSFELEGAARFIPVRSEADRIFTCFLEYHTDYVAVYDIVHEKTESGWQQRISCYQKIKISEAQIKKILVEAGFQIDLFKKENGLMSIIAIKG